MLGSHPWLWGILRSLLPAGEIRLVLLWVRLSFTVQVHVRRRGRDVSNRVIIGRTSVFTGRVEIMRNSSASSPEISRRVKPSQSALWVEREHWTTQWYIVTLQQGPPPFSPMLLPPINYTTRPPPLSTSRPPPSSPTLLPPINYSTGPPSFSHITLPSLNNTARPPTISTSRPLPFSPTLLLMNNSTPPPPISTSRPQPSLVSQIYTTPSHPSRPSPFFSTLLPTVRTSGVSPSISRHAMTWTNPAAVLNKHFKDRFRQKKKNSNKDLSFY